MKYRDLTELSKTDIFSEFIKKFEAKFLIKDGQIFVHNRCLLLHIYGFYIEDCIFFEFYDIKKEQITHFGRLISDSNEKMQMKVIYDSFKEKHTLPISTFCPSGTIETERDFFSQLTIIEKYLVNLMLCDFDKYYKYFEPTPPMRQQEFEKILKEF